MERVEDARLLHNQLWGVGSWVTHNPAPNPSSLGRVDLPLLRRGYVVAAKTDGERAILLIGAMENDPSHTYAVRFDRSGTATYIGVSTKRVSVHSIQDADPCEGTLLDCEWLPTKRKLVVLDAMALCGYDVKQVPDFQLRLRSAQQVAPGIKLFDADGPIQLSFKPFVGLHMMSRLDPQANADGLIFMPLHAPVQTGRSSTILKWKWNHTVDALWRDGAFWFGKGDNLVACSAAGFDVVATGDLEENVVYELEPQKKEVYRTTQARHDKGSTPNQVDTAMAAMAHTKEGLSFDELLRTFADKQ